MRTLRIGDLFLQQVDDAPHIVRAAFHPGMAGIVVPIRYRGAVAVGHLSVRIRCSVLDSGRC